MDNLFAYKKTDTKYIYIFNDIYSEKKTKWHFYMINKMQCASILCGFTFSVFYIIKINNIYRYFDDMY